MILVGVGGKSGHGKDTIASYLVREHGFERVGWSDELKTEVAERLRSTVRIVTVQDEILGKLPRLPDELRWRADRDADDAWWDRRIHYALNADRSPAMRALLQEYGTDVRRVDHPDYWLDAWERRIRRLYGEDSFSASRGLRIVVPDTRFPNEAHRLLSHRAWLLKVVRPNCTPIATPRHASEHALDDFNDWVKVFLNDSTIDALEVEVGAFLRVLFPITMGR